MIIMLAGKQGSGKTTLANNLRDWAKDQGIMLWPRKFAEPLYAMHVAIAEVAREYGIPFREKEGELLQLLGTEWGRRVKGEHVWVHACQHSVAATLALFPDAWVIIDDLRFRNEFDAFSGPNVVKVRLEASPEVRKLRCPAWRPNEAHPSETDLDGADLAWDLTLDSGEVDAHGVADAVITYLMER